VADVIRLFNWEKKQARNLHQQGKFVKTLDKQQPPQFGEAADF